MTRLFKKALGKITGTSLFVKIMGIAALLATLLGAGSIIETRSLVKEALKGQINEDTVATAKQLETRLRALSDIKDLSRLHNLLAGSFDDNPDLKYVIIFNPQGQIITRAFNKLPPQELIQPVQLLQKDSSKVKIFQTVNGHVQDITWPVFTGDIGFLKLGISVNQMEKAIKHATSHLIIAITILALFGIIVSYVLAFIINKPLVNLIRGFEEVRAGNLDVAVRPWFADETGKISETFNEMVYSLKNERETRHKLMQKIIGAQEEERQRISRELHDVTSQSLSSLKIGLKSLEPYFSAPAARDKLEQFRQLLNNSLEGIHTLSVGLRPPLLNDFGLFRSVKELVDEFSRDYGIKFEYIVADPLENQRFSPAIEIGLYRVIQEALCNIGKHACASRVIIKFKKSSDRILLLIEDNGKGFDPAVAMSLNSRKPLGIFGMRERVEILCGKFSITSAPGHGVKINIEVPV